MTTLTPDPDARRGFRGWAAGHPVAAFLLLLFGIGYPLMALPILAGRGVIPGGGLPGLVGLDTERFSALLMVVGVMLPATLWVTWAVDGRAGLRTLLRRVFRWRFGLGRGWAVRTRTRKQRRRVRASRRDDSGDRLVSPPGSNAPAGHSANDVTIGERPLFTERIQKYNPRRMIYQSRRVRT
jgi:hypothetical protein